MKGSRNIVLMPFFLTIVVLGFAVLGLTSCSDHQVINSIDEYNKWLENYDNGFVKTKETNGFIIKVKLLPSNYLAFREYEDLGNLKNKAQFDSLCKVNLKNLTFLLTISPDEKNGNSDDVMLSGITNEADYNQKMQTMSFNMNQYVKLKVGEEQYLPVLSNMENTYGLSKSRNILFVFSSPLNFKTDNDFDFIYMDELFKLGINHFIFNKSDLQMTPTINLK